MGSAGASASKLGLFAASAALVREGGLTVTNQQQPPALSPASCSPLCRLGRRRTVVLQLGPGLQTTP